MVGPWCFLDLIGPVSTRDHRLDVPPHPHIGIQTVTWLLEGEMLHKDSLDNEALAVPGALNLMTCGNGIAHAEESPSGGRDRIHGVQLWVALPHPDRFTPPSFEHHAERPRVDWGGGVSAVVILGTWGSAQATGRTFSPLLAAELRVEAGGRAELPLEAGFEHGLVLLTGSARASGQELRLEHLLYMEPGVSSVRVEADETARILVLGGAPFREAIVMYRNFVARTGEEIQAAREDRQAGRRFWEVRRYRGKRLGAPALLSRPAAPNPMS
jgi:redox-sensitive bicupin YhaK (pirin superfamily)